MIWRNATDYCVNGKTVKSGKDHKTDHFIQTAYMMTIELMFTLMQHVTIISSKRANN